MSQRVFTGNVIVGTFRTRDFPADDGTGFDGGDGGGTIGPMEARVAKLEGTLQQIQADLAVIRSESKHYATKEDLQRELLANTWRIIGAMLTFGTFLTAVTYYIARNVH